MAKSRSVFGNCSLGFGLYRLCCAMDGCHGYTSFAKVMNFSEYSVVCVKKIIGNVLPFFYLNRYLLRQCG